MIERIRFTTPPAERVRKHLEELGCTEAQILHHLARGKLKVRAPQVRPPSPSAVVAEMFAKRVHALRKARA
jgi:hypothetical protein